MRRRRMSPQLLLFLAVAPIGLAVSALESTRPAATISLADRELLKSLPLNPAVTPATIASTICVPGWAKSVRPKAGVMRAIKLAKLAAAGRDAGDARFFELDHKMPIDLGGALDDPANLVLQPWDEAREKDDVEVCLSLLVCADQVSLDRARAMIWKDWRIARKLCD